MGVFFYYHRFPNGAAEKFLLFNENYLHNNVLMSVAQQINFPPKTEILSLLGSEAAQLDISLPEPNSMHLIKISFASDTSH